jgi:hypothetical protein
MRLIWGCYIITTTRLFHVYHCILRLRLRNEDGCWRSGTTLQAGVSISGGSSFTKDIFDFSLHLLPLYSNCSDR